MYAEANIRHSQPAPRPRRRKKHTFFPTYLLILPLVILMLNNGVLGMVRQWQTLFFNGNYSNTTLDRKTNFVALAEAFGAAGTRVTTPEELDAALEEAFATSGPYLVECMIDRDEFVLPMLPPGGSMNDIITKVGEQA